MICASAAERIAKNASRSCLKVEVEVQVSYDFLLQGKFEKMAALRSALSLARPCLLRAVGVRRMAETAAEHNANASSISLTFGSPGEVRRCTC